MPHAEKLILCIALAVPKLNLRCWIVSMKLIWTQILLMTLTIFNFCTAPVIRRREDSWESKERRSEESKDADSHRIQTSARIPKSQPRFLDIPQFYMDDLPKDILAFQVKLRRGKRNTNVTNTTTERPHIKANRTRKGISHSNAKHGDECTPAPPLFLDYCGRAKFPNTGRMLCGTPDHSPDSKGKCICMFRKTSRRKWEQLPFDPEAGICLTGEGGSCAVSYLSGYEDKKSKVFLYPMYTRNVSAGHQQCDNRAYFEELKTEKGQKKEKKRKAQEEKDRKEREHPGFGTVLWNTIMSVPEHKHEKEEKYLPLKCTKPHVRRFRKFNPYLYYCLSEKDRREGKH